MQRKENNQWKSTGERRIVHLFREKKKLVFTFAIMEEKWQTGDAYNDGNYSKPIISHRLRVSFETEH